MKSSREEVARLLGKEWPYSSTPLGVRLTAAMFPVIAAFAIFAIPYASAPGLWKIPVGILGVAAMVAAAARALRIGLWASPERILVKNYWRTYELTWGDVTDVSAARGGRYMGGWKFNTRTQGTITAQAMPYERTLEETRRMVAWSSAQVILHEETVPR